MFVNKLATCAHERGHCTQCNYAYTVAPQVLELYVIGNAHHEGNMAHNLPDTQGCQPETQRRQPEGEVLFMSHISQVSGH
jgi:hypothetical protein